MVRPMTRAEVRAPTRMDNCWLRGVAPTRNPVLRSCDVVPPLDEAMHTTAATMRAVSMAATPVRPRINKLRHVLKSVAMVMPEMGLDDEPPPLDSRDDTVTKRNPKRRIMTVPSIP